MVCECIQDPFIGSLRRLTDLGLMFNAKVILRQNINYKTTSTRLFHFSCPKPLLKMLKSCSRLTGNSEMRKSNISGNDQRIL